MARELTSSWSVQRHNHILTWVEHLISRCNTPGRNARRVDYKRDDVVKGIQVPFLDYECIHKSSCRAHQSSPRTDLKLARNGLKAWLRLYDG